MTFLNTALKQSTSPLYLTHQIQSIEAEAATYNADGLAQLMERAGAALLAALQERFAKLAPLHIICGHGNNAGDGFVLARLASESGFNVTVYTNKKTFSGDAERAYLQMQSCDVKQKHITQFLPSSGLIIDCILGTGLTDAPREPWSSAIVKINQLNLPVISADVPSGLLADTGYAPGEAIQADLTLSFIAAKPGLYTGVGPQLCGEVLVENLKVNTDSQPSCIHRLENAMFAGVLNKRSRHAHKGMFGHVLVIGGNTGFGGAASLAAEAALLSGAGLVSVLTHETHANAILARCPELMVNGVSSPVTNTELIKNLLTKSTVIVFGPGLGLNRFATELNEMVIEHIKETGKPIVMDADALNLLADAPVNMPNAVITPHPGEASRLLNRSTQTIGVDRIQTVRELSTKFSCTALLKGAGSLISNGEHVWISDTGNPGMATGGMGDVLSGIVAGFMAQGLSSLDALTFGVWLHGLAADRNAERHGELGMKASDIGPELRALLNHFAELAE